MTCIDRKTKNVIVYDGANALTVEHSCSIVPQNCWTNGDLLAEFNKHTAHIQVQWPLSLLAQAKHTVKQACKRILESWEY